MFKTKTTNRENKKGIAGEIVFLLLCFLTPVAIFMLLLANMGITYGGPVTLLTYDMQEQFLSFYASLRYVLDGTYSPFFSGGISLGGNYWGVLVYYMASPLTWITLFYDLKDLPDAIYLLTVLRIGLCGLTFGLYARFGLSPKRKFGLAHVVFSCCYALMSYNMMYSMCPMWIDGVILFPLVLLGIEKLLEGKKGLLYFLSIAGAFICSYYISYMIGIFAAAYILCRVAVGANKENLKSKVLVLLRFGACTLLALGAAMPGLLPALLSIVNGKADGGSISMDRPDWGYNFTVLQLLQKLLPVQYDSVENQGLPSIYCGTLMCILALIFFVQKKHGGKKKIAGLVLLTLPLSGFLCEQVDVAWHIFQYPHCYPYRYAFLFSAVVLMLAWCAYEQIPKTTDLSKMLVVIGGCYLCIELFLNGGVIFSCINQECIYSVENKYNQCMEKVRPLVEEVKQDESFYRTENTEGYTNFNEGLFYGLNSVSSFVSTYNKNVNMLLRSFGGFELSIISSGNELTPFGDSLFGIKYRISSEEELPGYTLKSVSTYTNEVGTIETYLHENPNALSIAYMVDEESVMGEFSLSSDVFENQNIFASRLCGGDKQVFEPIEYETETSEGKIVLQFEMLSDNPVYFYILGEKEDYIYVDGKRTYNGITFDVFVKGEEEKKNIQAKTNGTIYLGTFSEGERVTVEIDAEYLTVDRFYLSEMNLATYKEVLSGLKDGQMNLTSFKGGNFTGTVQAGENQMLLITLPCEAGYTVNVDGEESEIAIVWGTLLAVPLTAGEHSIEITYTSPGFEIGLAVCIGAWVLTLLYFVNKNIFFRKTLGKCCINHE